MDIVGIGLANIDLISHVPESFLSSFKIAKGQAVKCSDLDFARLRGALPAYDAQAGGCAANTICGLATAGFSTRFYGKLGDDPFAHTFISGCSAFGVAYDVPALAGDSSQCAVLITPDAERSFAYTNGASWSLSPEDINFPELATAGLIYTEIYAMAFGGIRPLWPELVAYLRKHKIPLAIKVIDQEYAALYRTALFSLAEEGILTILIGNKDNLKIVSGHEDTQDIIAHFQKWHCAVLMTDGRSAAHYMNGTYHESYQPDIEHAPLNSSGAGDQFAAGFLEGFLHHHSVEACLVKAGRRAKDILMVNAPRPIKHKKK